VKVVGGSLGGSKIEPTQRLLVSILFTFRFSKLVFIWYSGYTHDKYNSLAVHFPFALGLGCVHRVFLHRSCLLGIRGYRGLSYPLLIIV